MAKMAQNRVLRLARDMTYAILGSAGLLYAYDPEASALIDEVTGVPEIRALTEAALFAQGPPIYGGTDQIQRNVLAERTLGLPREPGGEKASHSKIYSRTDLARPNFDPGSCCVARR
jgi:alkylation response protein AidB-like acyl-CoA dehydrogenase